MADISIDSAAVAPLVRELRANSRSLSASGSDASALAQLTGADVADQIAHAVAALRDDLDTGTVEAASRIRDLADLAEAVVDAFEQVDRRLSGSQPSELSRIVPSRGERRVF